jgi:hypothetical protein
MEELLDPKKIDASQIPKFDKKLQNFLESKPRLSWLHDIKIGNYRACGETTATLALSETDDIAQKKILLSIQKLSLLADEQPGASSGGRDILHSTFTSS